MRAMATAATRLALSAAAAAWLTAATGCQSSPDRLCVGVCVYQTIQLPAKEEPRVQPRRH